MKKITVERIDEGQEYGVKVTFTYTSGNKGMVDFIEAQARQVAGGAEGGDEAWQG